MSTRARGFTYAWRPRRDTTALIAQVQVILDEYRQHLPLTCQQIFYRLVGTVSYAKDEKAYKRLCGRLADARRGGFIAFARARSPSATVVSVT